MCVTLMITSHPLVKETQSKVLLCSQRKRLAPTTDNKSEQMRPNVRLKRENIKKEKEMKREYYVSTNNK
jgi:hypothetical protein